jgi:hypothetical protein
MCLFALICQGSFVLYRLFNKHEQDDTHAPASNLDQQLSTSSQGNPQNGTPAVQPALASIMKDHQTLPSSGFSQLTEIQDASTSVHDKEQTVAHVSFLLILLHYWSPWHLYDNKFLFFFFFCVCVKLRTMLFWTCYLNFQT